MTNEIRHWEIIDKKLVPIKTDLESEGRKEPQDLEPWIESNPDILGSDIMIIGRQVWSRSKDGRADFLAIDRSGNLIIIELKRDRLPRDVLTQAIDYASEVSEWSAEMISEICMKYRGKSLGECFSDSFSDVEDDINGGQRILLVGFSLEPSLERMIKWLSEKSDVNINAVILSYIKTSGGNELLARTTTLSEEEVEAKANKKKIKWERGREKGTYNPTELEELLTDYLAQDKTIPVQLRNIMLPLCLDKPVVTREELKEVGCSMSSISQQLELKKNDFLRQILNFETPKYDWEKDNFSIPDDYKDLVKKVLNNIKELKKPVPTLSEHPA